MPNVNKIDGVQAQSQAHEATDNAAALAQAAKVVKAGKLDELVKLPVALKTAADVGNVTPKGACGAQLEAFLLNGQVLVRSTPVVPNAKPRWYSAGMLPGHKPVPDSEVLTAPRWKGYTGIVKDNLVTRKEVSDAISPFASALKTDKAYREAINDLSAHGTNTLGKSVKMGPGAKAALDDVLKSAVSDRAFTAAVKEEIFSRGAWEADTSHYEKVSPQKLPSALKKPYAHFKSFADGDVSVHMVTVMGRPVYIMDAYVDAGETAGSMMYVYDGRGRSLDIGSHADPTDEGKEVMKRADLPTPLKSLYDTFVAGNTDKDAQMYYTIDRTFPNGVPRFQFVATYDYGDGVRSAEETYDAAGKRLSKTHSP